ncbi:hypothetical protein ACROYT_G006880 [Oculina patagonica]
MMTRNRSLSNFDRDGAPNRGPVPYPKEILHIDWLNNSAEVLKEGYKNWANTYEEWVNGTQQYPSRGYVGHIECADAFNTAVNEIHGDTDKKNLKLLDLGCGTGLVGKILNEKYGFDNLVGLDLSEDMIEKAKEKGIYKKFICSYVTSERVADIENAEFDGVLSSGVITQGQVEAPAFDEILRWIRPGGIICFNCRSDGYETEEYGFKDKFESLEKQKRWKLISNTDCDYYGDRPHPEGSFRGRLLVYGILPF